MNKKIKILNEEYEVKDLTKAEQVVYHDGVAGRCDGFFKTIEMYLDRRQTMLHEMTHAYLFEMGHKMQSEDGGSPHHTEDNVDLIAKIIENMIKDGHLSYSHDKINIKSLGDTLDGNIVYATDSHLREF